MSSCPPKLERNRGQQLSFRTHCTYYVCGVSPKRSYIPRLAPISSPTEIHLDMCTAYAMTISNKTPALIGYPGIHFRQPIQNVSKDDVLLSAPVLDLRHLSKSWSPYTITGYASIAPCATAAGECARLVLDDDGWGKDGLSVPVYLYIFREPTASLHGMGNIPGNVLLIYVHFDVFTQ